MEYLEQDESYFPLLIKYTENFEVKENKSSKRALLALATLSVIGGEEILEAAPHLRQIKESLKPSDISNITKVQEKREERLERNKRNVNH